MKLEPKPWFGSLGMIIFSGMPYTDVQKLRGNGELSPLPTSPCQGEELTSQKVGGLLESKVKQSGTLFDSKLHYVPLWTPSLNY